jgi:hypothetical protein
VRKVDRGNGIACGQAHELPAPAAEERISCDEERAGLQSDEVCESAVDLAVSASLQDRELHSFRARCVLCILHVALGIYVGRVHKQSDHTGPRDELGQQLKPLGRQLGHHECYAW